MTSEALSLLMGGGAVTVLAALVKAWRDIRAGKRADERDTIADLEALRRSALDALQQVTVERDYWRDYAGTLSYRLAAATGEQPERPPYPGGPRRAQTPDEQAIGEGWNNG